MDHYARSLGVQTASVSQAVPGHSHLVRYRSNLNNCCLQQGLHKLIPPEHDLTSPNLQPITIPSNSWNHSLESTVSCLSCNNVHPTLHLMQASRAGGQTSMSTAGGSARLARLTGYLYHELYFWHNPGPIGSLQNYLQPVQHFEHTETKRRLHNLLDVSGLLDQLKVLKPRPATLAELTRAHTVDYVESVKAMSEDQSKVVHRIGDESAFMPGGFDIAALAAGGAITATEQVLAGDLANVYALCRPPGHHAEQQMGGGYCLFNNVAIAALHALTEFQLDRVAVVDFDVHHGNGTQQVFQEDDRVLFISVHQAGNYPSSSGQVTEVGQGRGVGTTLNIPLPPGSGSGAYRATFDKVIGPALDIFKPQLIFVSAGFDANYMDPMGHMMLGSEDYRYFTSLLVQHAQATQECQGRIVAVHEGGYSELYVPFCGLAVVEQLAGIRTKVVDPYWEDVSSFAYQELQPHQDAVIKQAEQQLDKLRAAVKQHVRQHAGTSGHSSSSDSSIKL